MVHCRAMGHEYPQPPWHTKGMGVAAAFMVPEGAVAVPPPLEAVSLAGCHIGLLSYIEYHPPSPLVYSELVWMPTRVRYRQGGRWTRGYYVSHMYVDDEASLAAGRELWALPKVMARFERSDHGVEMESDDGLRLSLSFRRRGPTLPIRSATATLQVGPDGVVGFRGDFRGRVALSSFAIRSLQFTDPSWQSLDRARRLPAPALMLTEVETTMRPPREFGH